ncbi:hypothetical protein E4U15_004189 [Claviceps sp. LM218 group G6]|nr:hypothetical protein E4U15_004189 [Claviceps sp. LM218 group G6]
MSSSLTSSLEAAFKLPVISAPGSFDGSSNATRWLTKLQWSFQAVNEGMDADPNTFIKAMNMALEGQAATYVDSSELLRSIVARAGRGSATVEDADDESDYPHPVVSDLKEADRSTVEAVAQGVLWAMTMMSQAAPPSKKRKGMPLIASSSMRMMPPPWSERPLLNRPLVP